MECQSLLYLDPKLSSPYLDKVLNGESIAIQFIPLNTAKVNSYDVGSTHVNYLHQLC